ncbi:MAG: DUF92 domain-containing protein [Chloroflexi bacterium]|nr:DUF92 domain-containing protein [Chloroflexota bacterium]
MAPLNLLVGFGLSLVIAALAYQRGSLAFSGAVGAVIVGTTIFAGGGWTWGLLLVAFFVTSSALSHYRARAKEPLSEKFQKGHRRDMAQVLANGGWGALLAFSFAYAPQPILFIAFAGAIATVNADTWATELGVLSKSLPRLVTNGRMVPVGTSGGVTLLGTLVAFGGASLIGVLAFFANLFSPISNFLVVPIAAVAGLLGSLFDSLLGATAQAIYYCDYDQQETEAARHRCGRDTRLVRGWRWLDNDGVNFLASVFGSGLAAIMYRLAQGL